MDTSDFYYHGWDDSGRCMKGAEVQVKFSVSILQYAYELVVDMITTKKYIRSDMAEALAHQKVGINTTEFFYLVFKCIIIFSYIYIITNYSLHSTITIS